MKTGSDSKRINVRVSFVRILNPLDDTPAWTIRITDMDSGCQVMEIPMTDAEYAELHANRDLPLSYPADLNTGDQIGKRHEIMSRDLQGVDYSTNAEQIRRIAVAALTPKERHAGWEPSAYECSHYNSHRRKPDNLYTMRYDRYVEKDT